MFEKYDLNGDGVIDLDEFKIGMKKSNIQFVFPH